jgi:hypothetical protein
VLVHSGVAKDKKPDAILHLGASPAQETIHTNYLGENLAREWINLSFQMMNLGHPRVTLKEKPDAILHLGAIHSNELIHPISLGENPE